MSIIATSEAGLYVPQFLDLIGFSEGTSTSPITANDGYDVIVTGVSGPEVFTDYSHHPFSDGRPPKLIRANPVLVSTASGRYQILSRYFSAYKLSLHLPDFSPLSQDKVAAQMIRERAALKPIEEGDIPTAIRLVSSIWASFPGNAYGQNPHSLDTLMAQWAKIVEVPIEASIPQEMQ